MAESRFIVMTVRYEPGARYGRSLAWIAPELEDAELALTEDRVERGAPSATWAGRVEGRRSSR
jgi:hypothetical protein